MWFPPTEIIDATDLPKNDITMTPIGGIAMADGTQIWKITHNGVDTHPIHWHLYDLQLLNRVTWDNIIIPPDATELGWKDTIRISPLEDTIVAIRPIIPWLPFEVPNSERLLDPSMPDWDGIGAKHDSWITRLRHIGRWDHRQRHAGRRPRSGDPAVQRAGRTDRHLQPPRQLRLGVRAHCHILSHEEMDMMQPVAIAMPPKPPTGLAFDTTTMTLSWVDDSITETAFVVEKLVDGVWTQVDQQDRVLGDANVTGEVLSYTDGTIVRGRRPVPRARSEHRRRHVGLLQSRCQRDTARYVCLPGGFRKVGMGDLRR